MNSLTDQQLLRDYTERSSETAFAELVRRHVDLVYSAARRMVRDAHLAEDVTQGVFVALARNARQLADHPVLAGWLHRTAQNLAANTVRSDVRRRAREQEAAAMNELVSTEPDTIWEHIAPHLDAALGELSDADHDALLLRYFQNKSAREMAQTLGTSDDAAQKRVSRAVERLREFFAKRGVTIGAGGLVAVLSANAVQAAPVGLAVVITSAGSLAGATIATTTTATITKAIAMTTLQKTIIGATLAVAIGTGIYEAHQNSQLREQDESLRQEVAQMKTESESLVSRVAALTHAQSDKAPSDEQFNELAQLRGDIESLRRQNSELEKRLADVNNPKPQNQNPVAEAPPTTPLPADYPKTPDDATRSIFDSWARGDWDSFFTNFEVDGGRELWDQAINDEMKSNFVNMEVVSVGEPTNSFAANMWFVPYTVRFQDGKEKSALARCPRSKDPTLDFEGRVLGLLHDVFPLQPVLRCQIEPFLAPCILLGVNAGSD